MADRDVTDSKKYPPGKRVLDMDPKDDEKKDEEPPKPQDSDMDQDFIDSKEYPPGRSARDQDPKDDEEEEEDDASYATLSEGKSPLSMDDEEKGVETDARGFPFGKSVFGNFKGKTKNKSNINPKEKPYVMPTSRDAEEYNMGLRKRGLALIFHNTKFNSRLGLRERKGSDIDRDKLKETMIHLGFSEEDVLVYEDLTWTQIEAELKRVAKLNHTDHDCIAVSICTHGKSVDLLYARDTSFETEKLWEPFVGHKCITLAGKPKIFFVQACQGEKTDPGVGVDSGDEVDTVTAHYRIPSYADLLVYYSTMPGYLSWRSPTNGSWFVESLCKILMAQGYRNDLLSLLTLVNHQVAYNHTSYAPDAPEKDGKKQIPCITSMLTRKVVFTPKKK